MQRAERKLASNGKGGEAGGGREAKSHISKKERKRGACCLRGVGSGLCPQHCHALRVPRARRTPSGAPAPALTPQAPRGPRDRVARPSSAVSGPQGKNPALRRCTTARHPWSVILGLRWASLPRPQTTAALADQAFDELPGPRLLQSTVCPTSRGRQSPGSRDAPAGPSRDRGATAVLLGSQGPACVV